MMKLPNDLGEPSYMSHTMEHTIKDLAPQNNHQFQVIQIPCHKPPMQQDDFAYNLNLNRSRYLENTIPQSYIHTEYPNNHQMHAMNNINTINQCTYVTNTNSISQPSQYTGLKKVDYQSQAQSQHIGVIQHLPNVNAHKNDVGTIGPSDYSDFDLHFLLDKKNSVNSVPMDMNQVTEDVEKTAPKIQKAKRKHRKVVDTGDPNKPVRRRSKVSNPHQWKKNKQAILRLAGKEYVGLHGTVKKAKTLKPPCANCRMKCPQKISEEQRQFLFDGFWNMQNWNQRRQYVIARIHQKTPEVHRPRNLKYQKPREYTYFYSFDIGNEDVKVCKRFFIKTLDISHSFIKIAFIKKMSAIESISVTPIKIKPKVLLEEAKCTKPKKEEIRIATLDLIKQHIERFPHYVCHNISLNQDVKYLGYHINMRKMYDLFVQEMRGQCTKRIPEKKIYSKLFHSDYNFVFNFPNFDSCELCDKVKKELNKTDIGDEKKAEMNKTLDEHKNEATDRLKLKNDDDYKSSNSRKNVVAGIHMHKYLPTPSVSDPESYYLRKLWTLTLIIRDEKGRKSYFVWDETKAGRGSNEIGSCVIKWVSEILEEPSSAKEITFWSEFQPGHNRIAIQIVTYMWILQTYPQIKVISHKCLLPGHPEDDTDYTFITREKKKNDNFQIITPWDWAQFIRTCKHKHPFKVYYMDLEDFKNMRLYNKAGSSLINIRSENEAGDTYKFNDMVWIQVRAEQMGKVFYKTTFEQEEFKIINFRKKIRIPRLDLPDELQLLRSDPKAVSIKKFNDLKLHKKWMPSEFHAFYDKLKRNSHIDECPDPNFDDKTFNTSGSSSKAQAQVETAQAETQTETDVNIHRVL